MQPIGPRTAIAQSSQALAAIRETHLRTVRGQTPAASPTAFGVWEAVAADEPSPVVTAVAWPLPGSTITRVPTARADRGDLIAPQGQRNLTLLRDADRGPPRSRRLRGW